MHPALKQTLRANKTGCDFRKQIQNDEAVAAAEATEA